MRVAPSALSRHGLADHGLLLAPHRRDNGIELRLPLRMLCVVPMVAAPLATKALPVPGWREWLVAVLAGCHRVSVVGIPIVLRKECYYTTSGALVKRIM